MEWICTVAMSSAKPPLELIPSFLLISAEWLPLEALSLHDLHPQLRHRRPPNTKATQAELRRMASTLWVQNRRGRNSLTWWKGWAYSTI